MPNLLRLLTCLVVAARAYAQCSEGARLHGGKHIVVNTVAELIRATTDGWIKQILVAVDLNNVSPMKLLPGQALRGMDGKQAALTFSQDTDGLQLSSDNSVCSLYIQVSLAKRAIWNDDSVSDLGRIDIGEVTTIGRVQIPARNKVRGGHIEVHGLDIVSADARGEQERPQGARGFNVYTGTMALEVFDRIATHADGAVGVQISQPIGELLVRRGIETFGDVGPSLVKGVVQNLSAIALSIKPGGSAHRITIEGGLKTNGKSTVPLEQQGTVGFLSIDGGFSMGAGQQKGGMNAH